MPIPRQSVLPLKNSLWLYDSNSGDFRVASISDFGLSNYALEVARGNVSGTYIVNKFGRNPMVGTSAADIWGMGGVWAAPLSGVSHNIRSNSPHDSTSGTSSGAWTLSVNGLNQGFVDTTEILTLSGLNNVPTVNNYALIHRMIVLTAGSGGQNMGMITATANGGGNMITSIINTGFNQSTLGIYQVPTGYTAYMTKFSLGFQNATASATFDGALYVKPYGGVYNLKRDIQLMNSATSIIENDLSSAPIKFTEMTTLKVRGISSAGTSDVNTNFDLFLIKNG